MHRCAALATGVVLVAAFVAVGGAQQPRPSPPVFRAAVDHVELDVVVTDKSDRPVTDLTKNDFEISENQRLQTVADFQFVSIPAVRRVVPDLAVFAPSVDVVSNARAPLGRQWVLVLDDLHIIEQHLKQTRQVVQEFLESLPADDQVAIVFVGRSDLSQDFTSDLGAQLRTVDRIKSALGFAHDAANTPPIGADVLADAGSALGPIEPRERHRYDASTIEVLRNISAALIRSSYPRKALVYVSEGFTVKLEDTTSSGYLDFSRSAYDARDTFETLRNTFEEARRAGVPVYPIDPRGIPDCTSVRGECRYPPWENINAQFNNMRTLAENTGGLAFVNRPNLTDAVRELVADNSCYYLLGYYPQPFERDGKFHDVSVRVTRPGLRVRARSGYRAPTAGGSTAATTKHSLEDALGAALPVADFPLRATAAPIAAALHGMTTAVTLEITMRAPADGSRINDELQFGMVAIDHDGKIKASTRRTFHFTGSPRGARDITYQINDTIDLPSQPVILRIAVASQTQAAAGSIHVPVEPIDPAKDLLQVSALVIGFDGAPREAAVPPGSLDRLLPFQPTTARTFASSDTIRIFGRLFWHSSSSAVPTATLTVVGPHEIAQETQVMPRAVLVNGRHEGTFDLARSLDGLAAGAYSLRLDAKLPNGQTARRDVAFEIR
ncbi:MAG TPA: VWA domain-containing protein [Vicinamibacterales bacterium]|nr:VWA domain-containing protein [Vicinamibacterales bacterium]